jgi:hypothetical protein
LGQVIIYPSFLAHFPGQNFTGTSGQFSIGANTYRFFVCLPVAQIQAAAISFGIEPIIVFYP